MVLDQFGEAAAARLSGWWALPATHEVYNRAPPIKTARLTAMKLSPSTVATAALALCMMASLSLWPQALSTPGVDLFRYWAIPVAHRADNVHLGSPYTAVAQYTQALHKQLAERADLALSRAAAEALPFDLTATPLLYYLHGLAPMNYWAYLYGYRITQIVGLWAAIALLAGLCSGRWAWACLFAALATAASDPLLLDVNVGNTNAHQVLLLACVAAMAARRGAMTITMHGAVALMLVGLTLYKPTVALGAILLAWVHLQRMTHLGRAVWTLAAAACGALFAVLPCIFFGSDRVWSDWFAELTSAADRISYPLSAGNISTVSYLAERMHTSVPTAIIGLGSLLLTSVIVCGTTRTRSPPARLESVMNPTVYIATGLGLVMMLALSPLVWNHYLVLLLLPIVYLLCHEDVPRPAAWLGLFGLLLCTGIGRRLFQLPIGLPATWVPISLMLAWLPAWLALLLSGRSIWRRAWCAGFQAPGTRGHPDDDKAPSCLACAIPRSRALAEPHGTAQ